MKQTCQGMHNGQQPILASPLSFGCKLERRILLLESLQPLFQIGSAVPSFSFSSMLQKECALYVIQHCYNRLQKSAKDKEWQEKTDAGS